MVKKRALPGFGLSFGITISYLSLVVILPLAMLGLEGSKAGFPKIIQTLLNPRVLHAIGLTFSTAMASALINAIFGFLVAWVFIRYTFPGKRFLNTLIDLPFALPTAVAGIALTALYANNGPIGSILNKIGITAVFNPLGITIALVFIGMPFVIRTLEPVLEEIEPEIEEAAECLGASRWQIFIRILLPTLVPAWITGTALAFARSLGEYGSVVFISGNMPYKTEVVPLLIVTELEQYNMSGATCLALIMLVISLVMLLGLNALQSWTRSRQGTS